MLIFAVPENGLHFVSPGWSSREERQTYLRFLMSPNWSQVLLKTNKIMMFSKHV